MANARPRVRLGKQSASSEESYRIAQQMRLPDLMTASATTDCAIGADGFLTDCKLVSETPPGSGYGALQLKLAPLERFYPFTEEGFPATGMRMTSQSSTAPANPQK